MARIRLQAIAATLMLMLCIGAGALAERLCLAAAGDFEPQLRLVLDRLALRKRDHADIARLLDDTRATLRKQWTDFEVVPFGSLLSGLAMKGSDVDCYVRIPNYNTSYTSASAHLSALQETAALLQQQPALFAQPTITTEAPSPFITFYHIPTQRHCDIVYLNSAGVETSKLFRYYFNLDERFLPLARMIKFWAGLQQLTCHGSEARLRSYGWYVLTLFYLQQKHLAPSIYDLQRGAKSLIISHWDMGFNEMPYTSTSNNTENVYQLLGGFFKYYSEFEFENYLVSPYTGRPILRSAFNSIDSVPEELTLYKKNVTRDNINPIKLNSDLCIQDVFEHNWNTVRFGHDEASRVLSHIKFAAKMYDEVPRDRFLTAILVQRQPGTMQRKVIDDTIRKLKDNTYYSCINVRTHGAIFIRDRRG